MQNWYTKSSEEIFDNYRPFQLKKLIVSGSWGEGLFVFFDFSEEITPPDIDFMCILENINFTTSDQICGNLTVREDTPFVKAYITDKTCATLWEDFLPYSCDYHSSNTKIARNVAGPLFHHVFNTFENHVHSQKEKAPFMVSNNRPVDCSPIFNTNAKKSFANVIDTSASNFQDTVLLKYIEK